MTEILKADPVNPKWGGGVHYWGEPEAGYYIMKDEWIIRRHARMLSDAGVDLIVLDNTNDNIYKDVFVFIAEVFRKMRSEGEHNARRSPAWPARIRCSSSGIRSTAGGCMPICGSAGKASRC